MDASSARIRGRLAIHSRYNPDDTETLEGLRRDLRAARLEESVRQCVAAAPPLRPEQIDRLVSLLRPAVEVAR